MGLKIFRLMWFLSVVVMMGALLYGYAGWREELIIQESEIEQTVIGKEPFFYLLLATFAVVNLLVYIVGKVVPSDLNFRAWFHGLIITINIFSIVAMNLIGVYNSNENFDYSRVEIIIYGSIILVIGWAVAWPFYALYQKIFIKQAV